MTLHKVFIHAALGIGLLGIAGCTGTLNTGDTPPDAAAPPYDAPPPVELTPAEYFDEKVAGVLQQKCQGCHREGGLNTPFLAATPDGNYDKLLSRQPKDYISYPVNTSLLYTYSDNSHVGAGFNFNETQKGYLGEWITKEYNADNEPPPPDNTQAQFDTYVAPALQEHCARCHRQGVGTTSPQFLAQNPADDFTRITTNYAQYITADYNASTLYQRASNAHQGSTAFNDNQKNYLKEWLQAEYAYRNQ